MARLPAALKKRETRTNEAIRLRRENLERLEQGQAPRPLPEPELPAREAAAGAGPTGTAEPQADGQASVAAAAQPDGEYLRSRLSTVEGMLRSESERRRREQETARLREAQLQQRLAELQRGHEAAAVAAMGAEELKRYVTPQQLQEFGEDHCRLIVAAVKAAAGELTRSAVQGEVAQMRAELAQQRKAMERSQEAAFWSEVNARLPQWRQTNAEPGFLRWLGERDALAGRTRQEVLNEARAALDADRVVAIFNAWPQNQARAAGPRDATRRVMPNGKPPASMPAESSGGQTVSRDWIAEQNRLYAQGYYRRRQQEWQGVQDTIDRAAREGRIR